MLCLSSSWLTPWPFKTITPVGNVCSCRGRPAWKYYAVFFLFYKHIDEKLVIKMSKNTSHLSKSLGTKQKIIWADQFKSSGSVHLQLCYI